MNLLQPFLAAIALILGLLGEVATDVSVPEMSTEQISETAATLQSSTVPAEATAGPFLLSFFEPQDASVAARIRWCESRGQSDAQNPVSTAAGWFQVISSTWEYARSQGVDVEPFEVGRYDPEQNTRVAAWLRYEGGGWQHWESSAFCWSGAS